MTTTTATIALEMTAPNIYESTPPEDHIATIAASASPPPALASPNFGIDSLLGLISSLPLAPLYLYASLKGKFDVWDNLLRAVSDDLLRAPTLDVGCGRGMVLLKMAALKKKQQQVLLTSNTNTNNNSSSSSKPTNQADANAVAPAYGIDIFSTADQTGNAPTATYQNAAALHVTDHTVLHTASFADRFPFADAVFGLVASNLAIHNAPREARLAAVREMARVCRPGGRIVLVDLVGYFGDHRKVLEKELGWAGVDVSLAGLKMMYGVLPCQILTATKPRN